MPVTKLESNETAASSESSNKTAEEAKDAIRRIKAGDVSSWSKTYAHDSVKLGR